MYAEKFTVGNATYRYFPLKALEREGYDIARLPYSIRVLLENVMRNLDGRDITREHLERLARWNPKSPEGEVAIKISRVVMQDYTGVPAIVDLATMRDIAAKMGKDPSIINPQVPVDLIIDHSVQIDHWGSREALRLNLELEIQRNRERYRFLKWAQQAFKNLRVFPPGTGIIHQVNLEYLAKIVMTDGDLAFFETLVGMDSHTTMINGLGVVGWGVGGVEAEAAMLGEPITIKVPRVVGVHLYGDPKPGVTATDIVLAVTEFLRKVNVVDAFVEFFGEGVRKLSVPDRATIANMAPEYGSTTGLFPVDENTLSYLRATGRPEELIALVRKYYELQGVFGGVEGAEYSQVVEFDLSAVERNVAGPTLPWQRRTLAEAPSSFIAFLQERKKRSNRKAVVIEIGGKRVEFGDGDVVIAAITSCTNTSNPYLLVAAGLLAKRAVELGIRPPPYVKTSFAPGSRAVAEILERSGLQKYLDELGFHVAAFGCTTCIGNSGPLPEPVAKAIKEHDILAAAVLSGNRNFEARVHPDVRAAYLASPPLVVAYALAGTVLKNLETEPLAYANGGRPVYLRDIWPTPDEVRRVVEEWVDPKVYVEKYSKVGELVPEWQALEAPTGLLYKWRPDDTYIQPSPLFEGEVKIGDITGARPLLILGDSITTDHISPAGNITPDNPAGQYLMSLGVKPADFNTFGARRGNWQVMVRGTFSSKGYRNKIGNLDGGLTIKFPEGKVMSVYDAAEAYKREGTPVIIVAGKNYGAGSSRDWAAKGPKLLGVRAVIAESFERIHRSNLTMVGIIPIQLPPGITVDGLRLDGSETIDIVGLSDGIAPGKEITLRIHRRDGGVEEIKARLAIYTWAEVEYIKHGGILPYVLKRLLQK
ncbi:aconitate hydratase AcnA [Pyrobaculum aerophilum]|uniref:Aconitate hydratase n=2 Tax=Pyrobaculum aerophilum TaxID=13773 RepID=Q8ZX30_PYRAE|nr:MULTISPECIES: aconitate hydratase AcnA [Pyrobaculum]AAL63519.1 aconitate hydratase [Pyrobaculum aerophilum str. IM2]MCX8135989.1 aconitate hydratase AcnA [Pyrobaculum aerophilum]HII46387.1 aconitate hydratase AcnA [Pyrobaculum aerophilum]